MPINGHPTGSEAGIVGGSDHLNETLIEKLWYEFDEQVTREQIRQIAIEVAAQFQNATVKTFIPVFIYRRVHEKLKIRFGEGPNSVVETI